MTIIFDPDSWDRAIDDFESCSTSDDAIRRILEAMPLPRTTFSAVDTALHVAGVQPVTRDIAVLHYVAGVRRINETAIMQASVTDYRATEAATTVDARWGDKPI